MPLGVGVISQYHGSAGHWGNNINTPLQVNPSRLQLLLYDFRPFFTYYSACWFIQYNLFCPDLCGPPSLPVPCTVNIGGQRTLSLNVMVIRGGLTIAFLPV